MYRWSHTKYGIELRKLIKDSILGIGIYRKSIPNYFFQNCCRYQVRHLASVFIKLCLHLFEVLRTFVGTHNYYCTTYRILLSGKFRAQPKMFKRTVSNNLKILLWIRNVKMTVQHFSYSRYPAILFQRWIPTENFTNCFSKVVSSLAVYLPCLGIVLEE